MKLFLIIAFFCCGFNLWANDTLTRAQVYNFNVGDTFDYKFASFSEDYNAGDFIVADTGYMRKVVTEKYYSVDSNTLYLVEHFHSSDIRRGNPVPFIADFEDTLWIDSIHNFIISSDDSMYGQYTPYYYSDTSYHGRIINGYHLNVYLGGLSYRFYTEGLGMTSGGWGYFDGCCSIEQYDTSMIYYSKNGEVWGSPFYKLTTGIEQTNPDNRSISLYPTLNDGSFYVKVTAIVSTSCQLHVYDVTGREIKRTSLNTGNNNVSISNASAGLYMWQVISDGVNVESGKMNIY